MDTKQSELGRGATESASSDEIRSGIRGTRRNMDQTLDELGERLHPRHLLDDVLDLFRGTPEGSASRDQFTRTSKRVGRTIAAELKEHPLPALLVGAGVLWWVIDANAEDDDQRDDHWQRQRVGTTGPYTVGTEESTSGTARGVKQKAADMASAAGDKISGAASAVGDKISDAASSVGEKISGTASSVGDKMADAGRSARRYSARGAESVNRQASMLGDRFRETSDDYPLAVGGAFLAAGLLAGLLLPRTKNEDEWMGEASDELKEQTREKAQELGQRGKEAAVKTAAAALDEARARGITPESIVDKTSRVVSEAVKAGKQTAREEGLASTNIQEDAKAVAHAAAETAQSETQKTARPVR